jgi:hypothetical protein
MSEQPCFECGTVGPSYDHHVVPRSKGGTHTVPLCGVCHSKCHNHNLNGIRQLTQAALNAKKARGELLGCPPYGFRRDRSNLVQCDEGEIVTRILELRSEGLTLRAIAEQLTVEGYRTRHGGQWYASTVRTVLKRAGCTRVRQASVYQLLGGLW